MHRVRMLGLPTLRNLPSISFTVCAPEGLVTSCRAPMIHHVAWYSGKFTRGLA